MSEIPVCEFSDGIWITTIPPFGVDIENRILILVRARLHPECLEPENEDGHTEGRTKMVVRNTEQR